MALQGERLGTPEDILELYTKIENDGRKIQLINGVIFEMSPAEMHGYVAIELAYYILTYVKAHKLGRVVIETLHKMPDDDANVLQPDISFTRNERLQPIQEKGFVPYMPDLAVEIKSPGNTLKDLRTKAEYYLTHGSKLVWIVRTDNKTVEVFTLAKDAQAASVILTAGDDLTGTDEVLPGFALTVGAIFPD